MIDVNVTPMRKVLALSAVLLVLLTGCRSYSPAPDESREYAFWLVCRDAIEDRHKALDEPVTSEELAAEQLYICGEEPPLPK